MMLRSSSTPVLGSLLPSFSDGSSSELHGSTQKHAPSPIHGHVWSSKPGGSHKLRKPFLSETTGPSTGFRRAQSEGNLEDLDNDSPYGGDEFTASNKLSGTHLEEDKVVESEVEDEYDGREGEGRMYLATGLGASTFSDGGWNGGFRGGSRRQFVQENGDRDLENHYKRMLEEDPGNVLALQNFAKFLYEVKGDVRGAEKYYSRAVLADPEDGGILAQYAKLIWEVYNDQEKANHFFEKAVRASPEDSHVHAAYASFLWNTSDDEEMEEEKEIGSAQPANPGFRFHLGLLQTARA